MIATVFMRTRGAVLYTRRCVHIRYITDPQSGQHGERQKHELVVNAANFNQRLIRDGIAEVERTRQSGRMRRRRPPSRCPARVLRVIRRREVCAEGLLAGLSGRSKARNQGIGRADGRRELTAWTGPADFTRHFYKPVPMRMLAETRADILALGNETDGLLADILGY